MRRTRRLVVSAVALVGAFAVVGCGRGIDVPKKDSTHAGAEIFTTHCAGCHTLKQVGAMGSDGNMDPSVRLAGPNFDVRPETEQCVLFALRNGGFGGGLMPANLVVGDQAVEVAAFVSKYAGREAPKEPTVGGHGAPTSGPGYCPSAQGATAGAGVGAAAGPS